MVNSLSSRDRLLAAAAREFAVRGFEGAGVDRIARAARLNKAMIYYHFKNKTELYRAIVRTMFETVRDRVEPLASLPLDPEEKVRRFIRALADVVQQQPHFPQIWLREFAGGVRHMDDKTVRSAIAVVAVLGRILDEGQRMQRFRAANPLVVHIGIVAPLLLFMVSDSARQRLGRVEAGARQLTLEAFVDHVTESTLGSLRGGFSTGRK